MRDTSKASWRPALGFTALANLLVGGPAYVVSFFITYAFEDDVQPDNHLTFVALIAIWAVVCGLVIAALMRMARSRPPAGRLFGFCVTTSLALNLLALSIGSLVSADLKDLGSVSAGFSTATDTLLVGGFLTGAVVMAALARRISRS